MAVFSAPSTSTSIKLGVIIISRSSASRKLRARVNALIAWLSAPAPMACTSAVPCSRIIPAIAPATARVGEAVDTLMSAATMQSYLSCVF